VPDSEQLTQLDPRRLEFLASGFELDCDHVSDDVLGEDFLVVSEELDLCLEILVLCVGEELGDDLFELSAVFVVHQDVDSVEDIEAVFSFESVVRQSYCVGLVELERF